MRKQTAIASREKKSIKKLVFGIFFLSPPALLGVAVYIKIIGWDFMDLNSGGLVVIHRMTALSEAYVVLPRGDDSRRGD